MVFKTEPTIVYVQWNRWESYAIKHLMITNVISK